MRIKINENGANFKTKYHSFSFSIDEKRDFNRGKSEEEIARWEKINEWTRQWARITAEEEQEEMERGNDIDTAETARLEIIKVEAESDMESIISTAETEKNETENPQHINFMDNEEVEILRREINPGVNTPSTNYSDTESEPTSDWS